MTCSTDLTTQVYNSPDDIPVVINPWNNLASWWNLAKSGADNSSSNKHLTVNGDLTSSKNVKVAEN